MKAVWVLLFALALACSAKADPCSCPALPSSVYAYMYDPGASNGYGGSTLPGNMAFVSTLKNLGTLAPAGDATMATQSRQPVVSATGALRQPTVVFDGVTDHLVISGGDTGLAFIPTTGVFEIDLIVRPHTTGNASATILGGPFGGTKVRGITLRMNDNKLTVQIGKDASSWVVDYTSTFTFPTEQWTFVSIVGNGTTLKVYHDWLHTATPETATIANLAAGNLNTAPWIGQSSEAVNDFNAMNFDLAFLGIASTPLTNAQRLPLQARMSCMTGVTPVAAPRAARRIAIVGDSISAGYNADIPWGIKLGMADPKGRGVLDRGISGAAYSGISTAFGGVVGKGYDTIILLGGINDVRTDQSAGTIQLNYGTGIIDYARDTEHATTVWITILPFKNDVTDWTSGRETVRQSVNTFIRAHTGIIVVDAAADFDDGTGALKAQYDGGDGLHLSQAGDDRLEFLVAQALGLTP